MELRELKHTYTRCTLADVPTIVETIQALRDLAKQSPIVTANTQSAILNQLAPEVLIAVSLELSFGDK